MARESLGHEAPRSPRLSASPSLGASGAVAPRKGASPVTAARHSVSRRWLHGESSQAWAPSVRADSTCVIEALRRLCRGHAVVQVSGRLVGAPGAAEKPHSSLPQSAESRGAFSQPVVARAAARLDPPPISGARAWQRQAPLRRWQVCSSPKPGEEDWRASPSAEAAAARRVGTFREGKRNEISDLAALRRELFLRSSALFPAVGTVTHLTSTLGGSSSANDQA